MMLWFLFLGGRILFNVIYCVVLLVRLQFGYKVFGKRVSVVDGDVLFYVL